MSRRNEQCRLRRLAKSPNERDEKVDHSDKCYEAIILATKHITILCYINGLTSCRLARHREYERGKTYWFYHR